MTELDHMPGHDQDLASTIVETAVVCTVTHNSAAHLEGWWQALRALHDHLVNLEPSTQSPPSAMKLRVIAVDCASEDESLALLHAFRDQDGGPTLTILACKENLGFAGGMNRACSTLRDKPGEEIDRWLFAVNPDARPAPTSLQHLVAAFERYLPDRYLPDRPGPAPSSAFRVGSVTGRLIRPATTNTTAKAAPSAGPPQLDACGMYWTRSWRHFDRGSGEADTGQYDHPEEVFAGTGAGTLFSIEALRDVALLPAGPANTLEVFDQDFHSFREDAELGLRLQERGWHCVYEPAAIIHHRRHNLPQRRQEMTAFINRHSLKNRYLLRILHQTFPNAARTLPALLRDLAILPYVVLGERSSLSAYTWLWRHRSRLLKRRRWLRQQQTVSSAVIDRWFQHRSLPLRKRNHT